MKRYIKRSSAPSYGYEVKLRARFEFGKNWRRFLSVLSDERIAEAEQSLKTMLELMTLNGKTFLDIGSGSGLFSLAAMRLGAERVHSFDYDPKSVACTQELKYRYFPLAEQWTIERGSALDADYLRSLGQWDITYSWGVLHHTGDMWRALNEVVELVTASGLLYISIYNDQGLQSVFWRKVKLFYNLGTLSKWLTIMLSIPTFVLVLGALDLLRLRNPLSRYLNYSKYRGMSLLHDVLDWLGGYPFEVARPEEILDFYTSRGFKLRKLVTHASSHACNEFVFCRQ